MQDTFSFSASGASANLARECAEIPAGQRAASGAGRTALVWCSAVHPAGGMERIAISIANGLAGCGWRVVLAGPFRNVSVVGDAAIRPEVEHIEHRPDKSLLGLFRTMRFLQRIVRQYNVDVISAHGSLFPLILTRTPVVWTEHDNRYDGDSMLRGLRGLAWRRIRSRVQRGDWRLVTVSRHVRSGVCQNLKLAENKAQVIYNGLYDAESLRALAPARMTSPYQIGFLGRLIPIKWPLDVFELSSRLNAMGVRHDWNVFGDGQLMPKMREALRSSGHSVRLHGLAKTPAEAFARMDLFCLLSRGEQEGLGMVLLEAMAANRLVVAWDTGPAGEVLAGRGTLVPPPFSLQRFAEAIASALRNGYMKPREHDLENDSRWDEARMVGDYDSVLSDAVRGTKLTAQSRA